MTTFLNMTKTWARMTEDGFFHKYRHVDDRTGDENVEGKVVVITGGNGGIGKSVVTALAKRGATVVMACRDTVRAEKVMGEIKTKVPEAQLVLVKLDLSDLNSVRACAAEIGKKFKAINILINNAGYMAIHPLQRTEAGFEKHLVTNHLGHFLFTLLLLKQLQNGAPSRIVCVASSAWEFADLNLDDLNFDQDSNMGFMNMRAYSNSKTCIILFAKELGRRLENTQIRTYSLCPGFVNSNLFDDWTGITGILNRGFTKAFAITLEQGCETVLYCALSKDVAEETGRPYHLRSYWKEALDHNDSGYGRQGF